MIFNVSLPEMGRLIYNLQEIERLAQYERLVGSGGAVTVGRRRAQRQSDLERVQDLFPNDYLALYEPDVVAVTASTLKMKTLLRKRPSLDSSLTGGSATVSGSPRTTLRQFLMEAPCQLAPAPAPAPGEDGAAPAQVQTSVQERHLFLFTDLLVVAKGRTASCFKLKECVRVSELWVTLSGVTGDTSFILGWPLVAGGVTNNGTTSSVVANYLVTYPTQAARDTWFRKIQNALSVQLAMEPKSTNIQIIYKDSISGVEFCKTVTVTPEMTTSMVIKQALQILQNNNESDHEQGSLGLVKDYSLWAKTSRDGTAVPLIGIERPHGIQMSRIRQTLSNEEGFDLEHVNSKNNPCGMIFELKKINKNIVKSARTPLKLFRRASAGRLWGVPLVRLCPSGRAPPPVLAMLRALYRKGPSTQGIFRRSANAKALKVLKEKIDNLGTTTVRFPDIENAPVLLVAALFKDFLRNLPQPLLCDNLYNGWISVLNLASTERVAAVRTLLLKMPKAHYNLLSYFVSLLQAIARKSSINLMCPMNLGVCVGPSLLWPPAPCDKAPKAVPALVELLILHAEALFGPQLNGFFGKGSPEPSASISLDSGAEESDSLHSVGLSLDSLDLTCPRKEKLSLSRDSGLTMSEDDSNSNGGNSPAPRNGQQSQGDQKSAMQAEQAQRVFAKCYTTEVHNVNGLPKLSVKNYNKCDSLNVYGSIVDEDLYGAVQHREPIYGVAAREPQQRYSIGTPESVHRYSNKIYVNKVSRSSNAKFQSNNLSPAKYITGLEPEKPPRVSVSRAARNAKVGSVYAENDARTYDSPAKLYSRAKSSEDLLYKSKKRTDADNYANVYSEPKSGPQVNKQRLQRSSDILERESNILTPGYSRVYSDPRISNYANPANRRNITTYPENTINHLKQSLGHSTRSQENLLDLLKSERNAIYDRRHKPERGNSDEGKTFARSDWTRQASRTKSLESNSADCPNGTDPSDSCGYSAMPKKCNARSADPAHACTGKCDLQMSPPHYGPMMHNAYGAQDHGSPRDVKRSPYGRKSVYADNIYENRHFPSCNLPHSKSLANIILHGDDAPYGPKNASPYDDNPRARIPSEYSEPIYFNCRNDVFYDSRKTGRKYASDVYSARPTRVLPDSPPVPPRNALRRFPPVHVSSPEEQKSRSKSAPPVYEDPPRNTAKHKKSSDSKDSKSASRATDKYILALDGSGTDAESESYV